MRVVYIADDGKEFDDEFECEEYEWILKHPHLKEIKCYDKIGKPLENIVSEDTYNRCERIVVPTEECVAELSELADYAGFCDYSDITEPGIWLFDMERKSGTGFTKEGFVKNP